MMAALMSQVGSVWEKTPVILPDGANLVSYRLAYVAPGTTCGDETVECVAMQSVFFELNAT